MTALHRKLIRDLLHMKGQAIAIALVVASGVSVFVMSLSTLDALKASRATYYDRYRFADLFAQAKRLPNSAAERIEQIPGVAKVELRIVNEVTIDIADMDEPIVGRLISIPADRRPRLNDLHLRAGRWISPSQDDEVLASEAFAEAHGFRPGDSFEALINGRLRKLTIVGVALSPEYVYQLRGTDLVPDDLRFGVFWMARKQLAAAFDMEGASNDVAITLLRSASEPEVIRRIDGLLERYGCRGAYGRDDQLSARFLDSEITQLIGTAFVSPLIFLGVAVFLLNVVVSRLVSTQRDQIATLKAFGYTNSEIAVHYLSFVLLITLAGTIIGVVLGQRLGAGMTAMYGRFYRFPVILFRFDPSIAGWACLASFGMSALGTLTAIRKATSLRPAEAMRPQAPAQFRATFVESLQSVVALSFPVRMVLREIGRRPLKAFLSMLGIALAVGILVLGRFGVDSIDYLMTFEYFVTQRQDVSVSLTDPISRAGEHDFEKLPGVLRAESYRGVPVRIHSGHRSKRTALIGLSGKRALFRLIDVETEAPKLPSRGVMLNRQLAEMLQVGLGDSVTIEFLEAEQIRVECPVTEIVVEFTGTNAYMDSVELARRLGESERISGAYLRVDANEREALYRQLKETPKVAGVTIKTAAFESFQETIAENQLRFQGFIVMFACVIAFGVVYNTARVSLSERSREMGTLRILGFTRGEIARVLLGELALLTLAAIPLGVGIGFGLAWLVVQSVPKEIFRFPLIVSSHTVAISAIITLSAAIVSGYVVRRRLDRMDLVKVLKQRE